MSPGVEAPRRVLEVLQSEGYIRGYTEIEKDGHKNLEIELKYYEGQPVISEIKRVSKPGRRVYSSVSDIPLVRNGLGISILSTSKGVMSDNVPATRMWVAKCSAGSSRRDTMSRIGKLPIEIPAGTR